MNTPHSPKVAAREVKTIARGPSHDGPRGRGGGMRVIIGRGPGRCGRSDGELLQRSDPSDATG